jgi:hypothetical protein
MTRSRPNPSFPLTLNSVIPAQAGTQLDL